MGILHGIFSRWRRLFNGAGDTLTEDYIGQKCT